MPKALEIDVVRKEFQVRGVVVPVLKGLHFAVEAGEIVALLGPSGCGKTTLLRMIVGLDTVFEGEILLGGHPIVRPGLDRGIVFQEPRLIPWMTVRQNVAFAVPEDDAAKWAGHAEQLLLLVGLEGFEDAWPSQLSGGMAQRVALARALVNLPELLVLDEPFGALDSHTRSQMQQELLRILYHQKRTTLMVTHDVDEALLLGDTVVVLTSRPSSVRASFRVVLPRPRKWADQEFAALRSKVMEALNE